MLKKIAIAVALVVVVLPALLLLWLWPRYDYLPPVPVPFKVERVLSEPIIHAGLNPSLAAVAAGHEDYFNINGPSLIRVPDWVENPLGKYYLYFAHHKGGHIRLAYADQVIGPWAIHEPGVLNLSNSGFPARMEDTEAVENGLQVLLDNFSIYVVRDMLLLAYRAAVTDPQTRAERGLPRAGNSQPHVASPEIFIDQGKRQFVMYYHGLVGKTAQHTRVAHSSDGLTFEVLPDILTSNYLRAFKYKGRWYGLTMPGILYRSDTGTDGFEPRSRLLFEPDMRHAGLWLRGDTLMVFWSRVGDAPESILVSEVDLSSPDWNDWRATEPQVVLQPELPWEGSELKIEGSLRGELNLAARELRDPFVFTDDDGATYLLYVGSGEQAIGLARLLE